MSTPPVNSNGISAQPMTSTPVPPYSTAFVTPSPTKTSSNQLSSSKSNHSNVSLINSKWQLSNEKPDLIKYSQNIDQHRETKSSITTKSYSHNSNLESDTKTHSQKVTSLVNGRSASPILEATSEPIYQNIHQVSSPTKYNRKLDLERDERILNELTRAADEIMNVSVSVDISLFTQNFKINQKFKFRLATK